MESLQNQPTTKTDNIEKAAIEKCDKDAVSEVSCFI